MELIRVIFSFNLLGLTRTPQRARVLPCSPFPTGCLLFLLSVKKIKKYLLAQENLNNRLMLI